MTKLDAIGGGNSKTVTIAISLIKSLTNTSSIVIQKSSVLHKLNLAIVKRGTTLGAVIHNSELGVCSRITNGNS